MSVSIVDIQRTAKSNFTYFSGFSSLLIILLFGSNLPLTFNALAAACFCYSLFIVLIKKSYTKHFLVFVGLTFLFTNYVRFSILESTQASPLVIFYEIALCITLVLCFGLRKIWPVIFFVVIVSYLKIYIINYIPSYYWVTSQNETLPTFVFVTYIVSYIFVVVLTYYHKMNLLNHELKAKVTELQSALAQSEKLQVSLKEAAEELKEFSSINSHLLRAPISRIQGVIALIEAGALDDSWDDKKIFDFLYTQSVTSLGEFKEVLSEMDESLHKKILALHTLYLSVDPDR